MDADIAQPPVRLAELPAAHTPGTRLNSQPARHEHCRQQIPLLVEPLSNRTANTMSLRSARRSGGKFIPHHPIRLPSSILALLSRNQYTLTGLASAATSSLSQAGVSTQTGS